MENRNGSRFHQILFFFAFSYPGFFLLGTRTMRDITSSIAYDGAE